MAIASWSREVIAVLVIDAAQVRELLPMRECVPAVAEALRALSGGAVVQPLRPVVPLPGKQAALAMMPAYRADLERAAVKVISVFPNNLGTPWESHQGAVLLFETGNGRLLAVLDAGEITTVRTAAASAVATQALARPEAHRLGLLGSGVQARAHLEAMLLVRRIDHVRVWSRSEERARDFAAWATRHFEATIDVAETARDAVRHRDIVCTVTSAREPVLHGAWLAEGTHVNAVGACVRSARELDAAAVARARLYVDSREAARHEAGDFLLARDEGAVGDEHVVGEIGAVLLGRVPGRRSPAEITLFESLGVGVEDLAAAQLVYEKALASGAAG
jgi:ornithine cyclodeaminase